MAPEAYDMYKDNIVSEMHIIRGAYRGVQELSAHRDSTSNVEHLGKIRYRS